MCAYLNLHMRMYFLETDRLFKEATTLISKSLEKREKLQELEEKLHITDNATRQQIIKEGKLLAMKRKLESLQSDMEMLYLSIKKRQVAIQSLASECVYNMYIVYFN